MYVAVMGVMAMIGVVVVLMRTSQDPATPAR